jgi:hypothetical protein
MTDDQRATTALFINFVMSLAQSGMMQMGKLMNPMTGKIEKDLDGAKSTIDLLMMVRAKTEGNLSKEENDILNSSISSLQMNYVEEMKESGQAESQDEQKPGEPTAEDESPASESDDSTQAEQTDADDDKDA